MSRQGEAFRRNTTRQAIDNDLMARWRDLQASKQQHVGGRSVRFVTLNEILKDLLDHWDSTRGTAPPTVFRSLDEARDT